MMRSASARSFEIGAAPLSAVGVSGGWRTAWPAGAAGDAGMGAGPEGGPETAGACGAERGGGWAAGWPVGAFSAAGVGVVVVAALAASCASK